MSGFAGLLPRGVVGVLSRTPTTGPLQAPESAAARGFSPTRLTEFRHGRDCARAALRELGAGAPAIPVGASREPLWPNGVVGSISHCGGVAAAIVAWERSVAGLGLDIETDEPLEAVLVTRICRPAEMAAAGGGPTAESCRHAKSVFTMKEAAYKALWPLLRRFLDFHDIEIVPGIDADEFAVLAPTGLVPKDLSARLHGRHRRCGGLLVSVVAIRH